MSDGGWMVWLDSFRSPVHFKHVQSPLSALCRLLNQQFSLRAHFMQCYSEHSVWTGISVFQLGMIHFNRLNKNRMANSTFWRNLLPSPRIFKKPTQALTKKNFLEITFTHTQRHRDTHKKSRSSRLSRFCRVRHIHTFKQSLHTVYLVWEEFKWYRCNY